MKKIQFLTLVILLGTSCYSSYTNEPANQVPSQSVTANVVDPFNDPEQVAKEKAMLGELDGISDDLKAHSERAHAESEETKRKEYMKKVQEIKERKAELMGDTVSGAKSVKAEEDQAFQEIVKSHEIERNFLLCQQKFKDKFDIGFPEGSEFDSIVTFFTGRKLPVEIKKEHMAEWANFYANQTPVFIVKEIRSGDSSRFSGYVVFMVSGYTEKWGEVLSVTAYPILAFNFIDPKVEILDKPLTIANFTAIMKKNLEAANGGANMKLLDDYYDDNSNQIYSFRSSSYAARVLSQGLLGLFTNKKLNNSETVEFLESFKSLETDEVPRGNFVRKWGYKNTKMQELEGNFMSLFAECSTLLEKTGNTEETTSLLTHFSKPLLGKYLEWLSGPNSFDGNPHLATCKKAVEDALK